MGAGQRHSNDARVALAVEWKERAESVEWTKRAVWTEQMEWTERTERMCGVLARGKNDAGGKELGLGRGNAK
jgi:hypothetical protein